MIDAGRFLAEAHERGFRLYTGVPCSYLKPFINGVIDSEVLRYVGAANEGDAIAIAAGAQLGGSRAVALFQNFGLGNAVNPLTSLTESFRIPILLITTLRGDHENQFYLVGSMGCASSLGLALALTCPERRIIVVDGDGDGAALMRLGAFATIGYERPGNLLHILLDNGIHESTGGQSTVSHSIDFRSIAAGCGYPEVCSVATPDLLGAIVSRERSGLQFVHVPILPGIKEKPPRPSIAPAAVAERLREHLSRDR